jgi:hypothetical protein
MVLVGDPGLLERGPDALHRAAFFLDSPRSRSAAASGTPAEMIARIRHPRHFAGRADVQICVPANTGAELHADLSATGVGNRRHGGGA